MPRTSGVAAMNLRSWSISTVATVLLAVAGVMVTGTTAEAAVRTCSASTPIAARPTLRQGDTGSCVKVAQQALVAKGYSVGTAGANGTFGPTTLRATTAFQTEYGLTSDGIIGPLTWGRLAPGPAYHRGRGPNSTSRVVLTFDDCPKSAVGFRTVVQAAKAAGVGLVLAPTGTCLTKYRAQGTDLATLARAYGQYVINHSVSHPDLTKLSYASVVQELKAPGVVTNFGRPPFGASNATVAMAYTAVGMRQWTWTVDTLDWQGKSTAAVVSYVVANSRAGDTVLMHMQWNGFTSTAINQLKSGLAGRGLAVCNAYRGTAPVRLPRSLPCTS